MNGKRKQETEVIKELLWYQHSIFILKVPKNPMVGRNIMMEKLRKLTILNLGPAR